MRTIAVTSGKGGVGKTNLSANLGIQLVARGMKTVIFDADLGLANLDVVLGVRAQYTLQHVLSGERQLKDLVTGGPGGVKFIAGGSGVEALVNLSGVQLDRFLTQMAEFERFTDILIFDTGAGIDGTVMTFLQAADEVLLVATPDPASMTDAYATAKALFVRKPDAVIRLVLNMVTDEAHAKAVFTKLQTIAQQFLGKNLIYGGHVRHDPKALQWIRKRQPFSFADPNLVASQDVKAIAASLLGREVHRANPALSTKLKSLFGFGLKRTA
ncbi:MAG TPA: MinD/ParA family protein [Fimbriimonadaceae bacterium]|nr:MinD/ParA family protein [Fimbriimonadaceae bacterium]